jgi:predicted nucleic acid-binding protein
VIYCDTSLLLALYIKGDCFHAQANRMAARFRKPIPFTLLVELEMVNGLRRNLAATIIDRKEHDAIFRQILKDEMDGILVRCPLDQMEHYAKARELSKKFTPEIPARSLDVLHVAAALFLQATEFASFDDNQRTLAEKAGLKLLPGTITQRKI